MFCEKCVHEVWIQLHWIVMIEKIRTVVLLTWFFHPNNVQILFQHSKHISSFMYYGQEREYYDQVLISKKT